MIPHRFSLTVAIVSSLACLLLLTWILLSLSTLKIAERDLKARKLEEVRLLASTVAASFPDPFGRDGVLAAMDRLSAHLTPDRGVVSVVVMGSGGDLFHGAGADGTLRALLNGGGESVEFSPSGRLMHRYLAIRRGDRIVGAMRLSLSLEQEYERLNRSRSLYFAYFMLDFILLLGFGSWLISRVVVSPVRRLLTATERIAAGDLGQRVHVPGSSEIAELSESFNGMVDALRSQREETERHVASLEELNRQLQAAREETVRSEKMASVGLLAAGMAHEIGTPISTILGYVELLQQDQKEGEQADCLRRIGQEAGRIDRLVRDLLSFARPMPPVNESLNLGEFLADSVDMLTRQGVLKHLCVRLAVEEDLPALAIDRHQLLQVLLNLLLNAKDAMEEGGHLSIAATRSVFSAEAAWRGSSHAVNMGRRREDFGGLFGRAFPVEAHPAIPCIRIVVSDTGHGMDAEMMGRIFDPFFTTKEPGKGTGLGLAMVARLVDSFKGRITVASTPGEGTAFTLWLPAAGAQHGGHPK